MGGQKGRPLSLSVKKVAGDLFPFRLMVKNKPWNFKDPKDMEGLLIKASHASYLFLQEALRIPTLTFLRRVRTHFLCPVMPLLVK